MPEDIGAAVESSWRQLWFSNGTYDLSAALKQRRRVGLSWFRPVDDVPLPDTGPVVVLNSEPWGVVSIDLKSASVSQLDTIKPVSFNYDPATGDVTAVVSFHQLKYAGSYEARRGQATASALKIASKQLNSTSVLAAAADPNDPIVLAKGYQDKLATQCGANGNTMLNTYYRHNNAYSQAFEVPAFAKRWATYPTNGKNTSFYAQQTQTAATPGNTGTVPVNGAGGNSDYNQHSWTMQLFLVAATKDQDAALAATQFDNVTKQPANQPQTVDNVLSLVKNSAPPTTMHLMAQAQAPEPSWRTEIRTRVAPDLDEIRKNADDHARGLILRENTSAPIEAQFNSFFPLQTLTLHGKVDATAGKNPNVVFTEATSVIPEVNVRLGIFPGAMHQDLSTAVAKAGFLKSLLGKRVASAVQSSALLSHMGRLMSLSLAEQLGPR